MVEESQADWAVVAKLPETRLQLFGCDAESVDAGRLLWEMKIGVENKRKSFCFAC